MRTAILLSLMVLLLASPALSLPANDNLIVPGVRIGRWTLQMSVDDLVRINGPASRRRVMAGRAAYNDLIRDCTYYEWLSSFNLVAITFDDKRIEGFKVYAPPVTGTNVVYQTKEGIGPLSSPAQVLKVYGKPTATKGNEQYKTLIYAKIGLFVGVDQVGVFHVGIFRPDGARRLWKF